MNEEEPLEAVVAEIRVHLRDVHAREDFDPELHVTWPGHVPDGAVATYIRETPRHPAGYVCVLCGARVFPVDPTFGHPQRNAQLLRDHPELRVQTHGLGPAGQARYIEKWDRGDIARAQLAEAERRAAMATKTADRPTVEARRNRCQVFLERRVRAGATVEAAIAALDQLRSEDRGEYEQIMGGPVVLSRGTLEKYWRAIPIERREAILAARQRSRQEKPAP